MLFCKEYAEKGEGSMAYRNELKFYISAPSAAILEHRLSKVLFFDSHTTEKNAYRVTSLYFDNPLSEALLDKVNGLEKRSKFRIRFYNGNTDYLRLEKKEKVGALSQKTSTSLSDFQVKRLLSADASSCLKESEPLRELSYLVLKERYRPCIFVDYMRKPFLFPAGNVRVTLDYQLKAQRYSGSFPESFHPLVPVLSEDEIILEIKYDSILPPFISALFEDIPKVNCAISKFAKCREIFL